MKVLLVSHAFSPGRGSEPGLGWNWAWYLSREHEIWALAHPEFRADVESWLIRRPNPNLHIVWLKATDWDPTKGQAGVAWHYLRWLKKAEEVGRTLHAEHNFDLVHHVSLNTISAPVAGGSWASCSWGPVGGAQAFRRSSSGCRRGALARVGRALRLRAAALSAFRAPGEDAAVLASNHETVRFLQSAGAVASRCSGTAAWWTRCCRAPRPRTLSPVVRILGELVPEAQGAAARPRRLPVFRARCR
jgi:hypothetical protein